MTDQIQPAIDEVEQLGSSDPDGADDLDGTIRSLSGISGAVANSFRQIASTLEDLGVHEDFAAILGNAANGINQHSSELGSHLAGGLMSHAAGSGGQGRPYSPQVLGVISTVDGLGSWSPDDPEDVDGTILQLSSLIHSVQGSYSQISQTLARTGAHSTYPEHLDEAAGGIGSIADEVEAAFTGGVLQRPGSGG
jgi:ABC-type transporter Mla subunit MlaD